MEDVLELIATGRLNELTPNNLSEEIEGLYEDILNFECGHPIEIDGNPIFDTEKLQ